MRKTEEIDFKYNFKTYWNFLIKYKYTAIIILLIILFFEATRTLTNFLFKTIIDKGTEHINNTIDIDSFVRILIIIVIIYISTLVLRAIFDFLKLHLINRIEMNMITDLKRKYFNHIIHLSQNFHTSNKTGSLISRIIRGGHAVERLTDVILFNTAPLIFQLILVVGSLIYFDITSAIVVFLTIIIFIAYSIIIQNKQKESNLTRNKEEDVEKAYISDVMTNIDSIKYFGKEYVIKNKFKSLSEITRKAFIRFWDYFRWLAAGQAIILGVGTFFLVYFPLLKFLDGDLTIGTLVFIYTVFGNLMGPLFSFVHGVRSYYTAMSDFQDLFKYGKVENDIEDARGAKELEIKKGEIEFKNVWFKYKNRWIFKAFNLKINKNQKIALVGHSGCGKSTLIKIFYRLYNLNKGEILIDNKNINKFKQESLRSELSIVPQECVLFDDTIFNNIAFSKPGATKKEVLQAMKFAQLDTIIQDFPNKEKTIVGERGVKLSGGEKQRVSIARAILADKKVLVLDEATSSLDSETEYEIQRDLQKLMKDRTSIIIAHRLSTIMHADKIIVMKKGKIIQSGKHNDLIKKTGEYRKLWNLQKGGYIK